MVGQTGYVELSRERIPYILKDMIKGLSTEDDIVPTAGLCRFHLIKKVGVDVPGRFESAAPNSGILIL